MVVDASALRAILLGEPDAQVLAARLDGANRTITHPVSVFEAVVAVARESRRTMSDARADVDALLSLSHVVVVPIGIEETVAATDAFARYGKGRHPAQLNMGDCFSYAVAKLRGMPLLYKDDDFAQTDIA